IDRYYELTRRPGNRRAMIEVFRLQVRMNRLRRDTPERVERIGVPTLLMWGDRDRWISPQQVELWRRDLPTAQIKVYSGIGHVPMEEIPERSSLDAHNFLGAKRCQAGTGQVPESLVVPCPAVWWPGKRRPPLFLDFGGGEC